MSQYGIAYLERLDNKKKCWVNASVKDQTGKDLFLYLGCGQLRDMIKDDLSELGKGINWNDPDSLDYASEYIVSRCKAECDDPFYTPVQRGYIINFAELINYYHDHSKVPDYYAECIDNHTKKIDNPVHLIINNVTAIMNMMDVSDTSEFRVVFWIE